MKSAPIRTRTTPVIRATLRPAVPGWHSTCQNCAAARLRAGTGQDAHCIGIRCPLEFHRLHSRPFFQIAASAARIVRCRRGPLRLPSKGVRAAERLGLLADGPGPGFAMGKGTGATSDEQGQTAAMSRADNSCSSDNSSCEDRLSAMTSSCANRPLLDIAEPNLRCLPELPDRDVTRRI